MHAAFVIFESMTALDFVGAFDPVSRLKTMGFLPDLSCDICGRTREVRDSAGIIFCATRVAEPLSGYDLVVVSGGPGTRMLVGDSDFVAWIRSAAESELVASVCTGSLLLGAAGLLEGHAATSHSTALSDLRAYVDHVVSERIVDSGRIVTAAGVTSSIDLGLYLCEKFAGPDAREQICAQIEYRCFDSHWTQHAPSN